MDDAIESADVIDVWTEAHITNDGIGLTLFTERRGIGPVVEHVEHFDLSEIEQVSGEVRYLRPGESARQSLLGREEDTDTLIEEATEDRFIPTEGDRLVDKNPPSWSSSAEVEVVEVLSDVRADEYLIDGPDAGTVVSRDYIRAEEETVASVNPDHPSDDPVVVGRYVHGTDKEYAYPLSRLRPFEGLGELFMSDD